MQASTLLLSSINGAKFKKEVKYFIPYDLGVTFGSIYQSFMNWVKTDLRGAVKFKTDFIRTQIIADKRFLWSKGILATANKPLLAIQCTVDHQYESEIYRHPSMRNWDAIGFLEPKEFTQSLIAYEDPEDISNNLEYRFSVKPVKFELQAGVAVTGRVHADNIANYWKTKRSDDWWYDFPIIVDFKIPDEIINTLCNRFRLDKDNHHVLLRWLNKNSRSQIYYAVDGYNGKWYYFFRYRANPLIHVTGLTNPTAFDIQGQTQGEAYTVVRSFEIEVLVPSIISLEQYGDRLDLKAMEEMKVKNEGVEVSPEDYSKAHVAIYDRYVEIERMFDKKHAFKKIEFQWTDDDLKTHKDGSITSVELDLHEMIKDDDYIQALLKWCKTKGYKMHDIFNFQMYIEDTRNNKIKERQKRTAIESDSDKPIDLENFSIPEDNDEYKYYIKNMSTFTIVDLKPEVDRQMLGILYINLEITNQFDKEIEPIKDKTHGNDDLGMRSPFGRSDVNKGTNIF